MASATFPVNLGGDGSTVTDDSSVTTGLANGGHRTRFVPALAQTVAVLTGAVSNATAALSSKNAAATSEANAAASAATAINAPGTQANTLATLPVATGSITFTLAQTGKAFIVGQWVAITDTAAPGRWLAGQITAFTPGTGVISVTVIVASGTGTASAWAVTPTAPIVTTTSTQWAGVNLGALF